jgi:hypothetical protein
MGGDAEVPGEWGHAGGAVDEERIQGTSQCVRAQKGSGGCREVGEVCWERGQGYFKLDVQRYICITRGKWNRIV